MSGLALLHTNNPLAVKVWKLCFFSSGRSFGSFWLTFQRCSPAGVGDDLLISSGNAYNISSIHFVILMWTSALVLKSSVIPR